MADESVAAVDALATFCCVFVVVPGFAAETDSKVRFADAGVADLRAILGVSLLSEEGEPLFAEIVALTGFFTTPVEAFLRSGKQESKKSGVLCLPTHPWYRIVPNETRKTMVKTLES